MLQTENHKFIIEAALTALRSQGVIAFPTDTVFGLAADMKSETAVKRLYSIKRRPLNRPVPVMIHRKADLVNIARNIPEDAWKLIDKYWPGALTLALEKTDKIPDWITGGGSSVAVRIPDHPTAMEILEEFNSPLAVTSANISGAKEFTSFTDVQAAFGDVVDVIVPGEVYHRKISTVVDFTKNPPELVRGGIIKLELKHK